MRVTNNRIRQARRKANLTQVALAKRVGVHRSAVAQWEQAGGPHPTVENAARIALATSVSFEWLVTGRGMMTYSQDLLGDPVEPTILLEHTAQCETEARALVALRKLDFHSLLAVVEMVEGLGRARAIKLGRAAPYSR